MPRSNRKPKPKPPQSTTLTERQQAVLDFIVNFIEHRHIPPTVREIGKRFGIRSPNGVVCHLRALEQKGRIGRYEGLSRGVYVL